MQKKRYILKPFSIKVGMNKAYELMKAEKESEPVKDLIREETKGLKKEIKKTEKK